MGQNDQGEGKSRCCEQVDENHSFLDGYWCGCIGRKVDWIDSRDYCRHPGAYENCPVYLGEPILDEETCDAIRGSVESAVSEAKGAMKAMGDEMSGIIQNTGLRSLADIGERVSSYDLRFPSARGITNSSLHFRSEERLWNRLLGDIDRAVGGLSGSAAAYGPVSSQPSVSSEDFRQMQETAFYGQEAAQALSACSLDADEVFSSPIERYLSDCAGVLEDMAVYVMQAIEEASRMFEEGVARAVDGARSFGHSTLTGNITWIFDGYL